MTLLTTKLYIPQPRPNLVPRRRLTERLEEGLRQGMQLTLVSAPAGFGKTTLLSEWLRSSERPVAWVSLDENDNDPVSFWTYFIAALQTIQADTTGTVLGEDILTTLQSSGLAPPNTFAPPNLFGADLFGSNLFGPSTFGISTFAPPNPYGTSTFGTSTFVPSTSSGTSILPTETSPPLDVLLTDLLNEIAEFPIPFTLVLDDYHAIEGQLIHDTLTFLLDHLPPQMHLVIASRVDPPLPLARLRGRYLLTELREADLRFTHREADAFLNKTMGLGLSKEDMAALAASTEGWIVGLQLAALSLKGMNAARADEFIQAFSGSHRYVIDYLVEEVLQQQTDEVRAFLFRTSILERMTASLCDAVTEHSDSQAVLAQLERANLFLVPLDEQREWYRYHHLFADFLRAQAKMQLRSFTALHQKAARWYENNGFRTEAIKHTLAAGDTVDAARLIALAAKDTLRHARFVTFFNWIEKLPEELVWTDCDLTTTMGWALTLKGEVAAAESYAKAAARCLPVDAPTSARAKVISLQAFLTLLHGGRQCDREDAIRQAKEALELIGDTNPLFRGMLLSLLGESQRVHGNLESATRTLREAVTLNQQVGNHIMAIIAISNLAVLLHQQGQRREAAALCQQTIARYVDARGRSMLPAGVAYILLATMHYEANELSLARHCLHKGLKLNRYMALLTVTLMGKTLLARLQQAMGETQAALATIQETCRAITKENTWRMSALSAMAVEAGLQLKYGHVAIVAHWAERNHLTPTDTPSYSRESLHLAYVRLLLAQNRPQEACTLLAKLEHLAQEDGRHGSLVTIHALQALAQQALGQKDRALTYLRKALHLAAPGDYYRSLLDEGPLLAGLLFQVRGRLGETLDHTFVHRLLKAFQAELVHTPSHPLTSGPSALVEPLTKREREVLQLIIAGLSNQEIAAELYLAMGTVKKHITNIYGKLGVRRRAQAIARAKELGLL